MRLCSPGTNAAEKYSYSNCGHQWVNEGALQGKKRYQRRANSFEDSEGWLQKRRFLIKEEGRIWEWLDHFSAALKRRRLRSLPLIWGDCMNIDPPFHVPTNSLEFFERSTHFPTERNEVSYSPHVDLLAYREMCIDIYKLVPGTFVERVKRACLLEDMKLLRNELNNDFMNVVAYAYLIWRRYWEGTEGGLPAIDRVKYTHVARPGDINCGYYETLRHEVYCSKFFEAILLALKALRGDSKNFKHMTLDGNRLMPY